MPEGGNPPTTGAAVNTAPATTPGAADNTAPATTPRVQQPVQQVDIDTEQPADKEDADLTVTADFIAEIKAELANLVQYRANERRLITRMVNDHTVKLTTLQALSW